MALERGDLGFMLGLAGFMLGGLGAFLGYRAVELGDRVEAYHEASRLDGESIESIVTRLTAMEQATSGIAGHAPITPEDLAVIRSEIAEANKRTSAASRDVGFLRDEIASLRARVSELEAKLAK